MSKVSIIVPIYNVEKYLKRNLESLKNQTFQDITVYCINDGSTDESQKIIDEFTRSDERFISFIKTNGGLSDARNYGLKKADSPYIMFIDSDDFCEAEMVEKCVDRMEKDHLDMVVFSYNQFYQEQNRKEKIEVLFEEDKIYSLKEDPQLIAYTSNAAWNKMYRTELFLNHSIEYPYGYRHQDLGTTPRLLYYCTRVGFIKDALYNYLIDRPNNITQMADEKIYHILDMLKINFDFYIEKGCFDQIKKEFQYLAMINCIVSLRKAMRLKNRKFVFQFIDDCFDMLDHYFGKLSRSPYDPIQDDSDKVYCNRVKCKMYYCYKQLKGRN